jgi:hypothetical protein
MATLKTLLSNLSLLKDVEEIIWFPDPEQEKLTEIKYKVTEYEKNINPLLQANMHDLIFAYNKLKRARAGLETLSVKELATWDDAFKERKERAKSYYDIKLDDDMNKVNSDIVTMIKEITLTDDILLAYEMVEVEKNLQKILEESDASSGGRRRTNKKRSTRRKKKRGKRTRKYRTKR